MTVLRASLAETTTSDNGRELAGKVALVTGGGRGLGRGLATALGRAGAAVAIAGRTGEILRSTAVHLRAEGIDCFDVVCDVGDASSIDALVDSVVGRFGDLDILVNNALSAHGHGPLLEVPDAVFVDAFTSGPLATLRLMRACHPFLRDGGVVVNLASGVALRSDPLSYGVYGTVKEAVRFLSRVAAVEWAGDGIRVHALLPLAQTESVEAWAESMPADAAAFLDRIPMRRFGDPTTDVGDVVVFLCSNKSRYMTGGSVLVDGGFAYLG